MKSDCTKHDLDQVAYDLKVLAKIMVMSEDQILDLFQGIIPKELENKLPEILDTDAAIVKAGVLVLLFKS